MNDWATLSYAQLVQDQELIAEKVSKAKKAGKILSKGCLREIVEDLPRYNSFSYINNGSLTNEYFHTAEESLNDGYLYFVITKSKSPSSEVIGLFTNSHITMFPFPLTVNFGRLSVITEATSWNPLVLTRKF